MTSEDIKVLTELGEKITEHNGKLDAVCQKMDKLEVLTLGVPGTDEKGLVGEITTIRKEIVKFNRNFWILVGVLVGSGVLVGGGLQLFG